MAGHAFASQVPAVVPVIDVRGRDLDDLFESAARALAALLGDTRSPSGSIDRTIALDAPSLDVLLHEWLAELVRRCQQDGEIFPCGRVAIDAGGQPALAAIVAGGPVGGARRPCVVQLGMPSLQHGPEGWQARIPIDVRA